MQWTLRGRKKLYLVLRGAGGGGEQKVSDPSFPSFFLPSPLPVINDQSLTVFFMTRNNKGGSSKFF